MRQTVTAIVLFLFFSGIAYAGGVDVSGNFDCMSNGIAPVPSFSFGDSACMVFVTIGKGGFEYTIDYASGFDETPWFLDNWLRYTFNHDGNTTFRLGVDIPSLFFGKLETEEGTVVEAQNYRVYEAILGHTFSERWSAEVQYWFTDGRSERTVDGHFLNLSATYARNRFEATPGIFYIDFTDGARGWFANIYAKYRLAGPLWATVQLVQSVDTQIVPDPGLENSFGLSLKF